MSNIQIDFLNKYLDSNRVQVNGNTEDDDDDDDTTLTEDLWSSTPTTSSQFSGSQEGRSSISSIPWAEDAIKQNEDEWKSIEEMFYGEKPLPENKIIRDEILEWTKRFPHIRVIGQQIIINPSTNNNEKCQQNNLEEIIAIDPSPIIKKLQQQSPPPPPPLTPHTPITQDRRIQSFINGMPQNLMFNNRKPSFQRTNEHLQHNTMGLTTTTTMIRMTGGGNMDLQNQIEKCLRITSGPLLSRRKSLIPPQTSAKSELINKLTINKLLTPTIHEEYFSRRPRVTSVRSDAFLINNGSFGGNIGTNRRYSYQQQQQHDKKLQHSNRHINQNNNNNNNQRTLLSPIKLPLVMTAKLLTIQPTLLDDSDLGNFVGRVNSNESSTTSDNLRKKPKLQSRFTLPALHFQPKFEGELIGRSISAINQNIPTTRY